MGVGYVSLKLEVRKGDIFSHIPLLTDHILQPWIPSRRLRQSRYPTSSRQRGQEELSGFVLNFSLLMIYLSISSLGMC